LIVGYLLFHLSLTIYLPPAGGSFFQSIKINKMKLLLVLLTGCTLLSAQDRAVAQAGEATARDQPAASPDQPASYQKAASRERVAANTAQLKSAVKRSPGTYSVSIILTIEAERSGW
jgi:hypothetical protein